MLWWPESKKVIIGRNVTSEELAICYNRFLPRRIRAKCSAAGEAFKALRIGGGLRLLSVQTVNRPQDQTVYQDTITEEEAL